MANFVQLGKAGRDKELRTQIERESRTIIALMGKTQAGKSTFIDSFTGKFELRQWDGDRRRTRDVQQTNLFEFEGRQIMFVEMPAFQDEPPSDVAILRKIAHYVAGLCDYDLRIAGIIYLHDVMNPVDDQSISNIEMMRSIAGKEYNQRLRLIINKTHENPPVERNLSGLWRRHKMGTNPVRNRDPAVPPLDIVQALLGPREVIMLALQRELVQERKSLQKTAAGTTVAVQVKKSIARMKDQIKEKKSEKKNLPARDQERVVLDQQIQTLKTARSALKSDLNAWKRSKERWGDGDWIY